MGKKSKTKPPKPVKKETPPTPDEGAKKRGPYVTLEEARAQQKEMEEWAKSQGLDPPISLCMPLPLSRGPATMIEPGGRETTIP